MTFLSTRLYEEPDETTQTRESATSVAATLFRAKHYMHTKTSFINQDLVFFSLTISRIFYVALQYY